MAEFLRCLPETVTTLFVNWPYPNTKQKVVFFFHYIIYYFIFLVHILYFFFNCLIVDLKDKVLGKKGLVPLFLL